MKLRTTIILIISSFVLLPPLAFGTYVYYTICDDKIYSTTLSPSGRYKVVVIQHDCALSSYSYSLKIGKRDQSYFLTRVAWLYGAKRDESSYGVEVEWPSESEINVKYFTSRYGKIEKSPLEIDGENITIFFVPEIDDEFSPLATPRGTPSKP